MKKLLNFLIIVLLIISIVNFGYVIKHEYDLSKSRAGIENIRETVVVDIDIDNTEIDFDEEFINNIKDLKQINEDLNGWIIIEDSNIDLPVMYKKNVLQYYLRRDFNKEYSVSGTPFIDERCAMTPQSDLFIIYGHRMNDGSMFSDLLKYENEEYFNNHQTIKYYTDTELKKYQIFAAVLTSLSSETQIDYYKPVYFSGTDEFEEYMFEVYKNSLFKTDTELNFGNNIMLLSTCSDHEDGRMIIFAKDITEN